MAGVFLPESCQVRVDDISFKCVAIWFSVGREQVWVGQMILSTETHAGEKDRKKDGVFHEIIS